MKKLLTALLLLIFYCCIINTSYATLPTPNTIYPACNSTGIPIPVNFQWSSSSGATYYHLQVLIGINVVIDSNHITATNVNIINLNSNTQYNWRVKAFSTTDSSNYSAGPCYFTTSSAVPAPPNLIAPPNNAFNVTRTPLFQWSHSVNAQTYHIEVSLDISFNNPPINVPSLTDTFYQISGSQQLAPGTLYYWRVAAANGGGESPFTTPWSFSTVPSPPPPPVPTTPVNGAVNVSLTPTLVWNPSSGATYYHVQIFGSADTTQNIVWDTTNIITTAVTVPSGILFGPNTYYWRVFAGNAGGQGQPSVLFHFTTVTSPPPAPLLYSPPNGSTCQSRGPLLQWQCITNATGYRVQVSTDPNFGTTVINVTTGANICQYQIPNNFLATNTTYYWHVNASNAGGIGPYSTTFNFTTIPPNPTAVTLLSPANNATNVSLIPTMMWSHGTNATSYRLQISANAGFTSIVVDHITTDTFYVISTGALNGCHQYYWRVYSINCALPNGIASAIFNFTTIQTINLNLKVFLEGFYNGSTEVQDTVKVFLANSTSPHNFVDTNRAFLTNQGTDTVSFTHVTTGNYYIVIRHRNHLETWSSIAAPFAICTPASYDFTTASSKAYGNNMKQVGSVWVLYGGDINQDGTVDNDDYTYYKTEFGKDGYRPSDLNGDNWIDGFDLPVLYSNFGHSVISPP